MKLVKHFLERLHQKLSKFFKDFKSKKVKVVETCDHFVELLTEKMGIASRFGHEFTSKANHWMVAPDIDVLDHKKTTTVKVELPGVNPEDIDLHIDGRLLTISAEKHEEQTHQSGNVYFAECRYGSYQRSIPLRSEIDFHKIKAKYRHGVLTIKLPKVKDSDEEFRQITVHAGN